MSDPGKAVFLSYASQDAEAARRICEALRSGGVEVWFDAEGGLEHGDEWDAKIRKQIKECVLFIPIISATTQAREEGYFRLEWDLAAERARTIASGVPFILPVAIDDTCEPDALVPDRFRAVQWTRLPGGVVSPQVQQRLLKLWSHRTGVLRHEQETARPDAAEGRLMRAAGDGAHAPRGKWLIALGAAVLVLGGAVAAWKFRPSATGDAPGAARSTAKSAAEREAEQLVARALAIFVTSRDYTPADLAAADTLAKQAIERAPQSADAWATRAYVQAAFVWRGWDRSDKRRQDTEAFANQALAFDRNHVRAILALAEMHTSQQAYAQAEMLVRRGLTVDPDEPHLYRVLAGAMDGQGSAAEAAKLREETARRFPREPLAHYALANQQIRNGDFDGALQSLDTALAMQRFTSGLVNRARLLAAWKGDLAGAESALGQLSPEGRTESRAVGVAMWIGLLERRPERVQAAAALTAKSYLDDTMAAANGPKALGVGLALHLAGKTALARQQWQAAEAAARQYQSERPGDLRASAYLAIALAWQGRTEEAAREIAHYEGAVREQAGRATPALLLARFYAALGEGGKAAPYFRGVESNVELCEQALRLDPWWDKIRGQPEFEAVLAEAKARTTAHQRAPMTATDQKSVAVLAFENRSSEKDSEYFSDGVSDELINVLGRVEGLRVVARTSSFSFKKKNVPTPEIGRALKVAHLIEGSVQRSGGKVRVMARLVRADTGEQLWGDSFEPDVKDIFAAQADVAKAIAQALSLKLGVAPAGSGRAVNPAAFDLYARGRQAWNLRTLEGLNHAEEFFRQALALEPNFARAFVGWADARLIRGQGYGDLGNFGTRDAAELKEIVRLVEQALALEPDLAEAHASRGMAFELAWRFEEGRRELRTAVRLNPNYATAHHWLARSLEIGGQIENALHSYQRAAELDPLSSRIADNHARALAAAGRWPEALARAEHAIVLQPDNEQARLWRARALLALKRTDEAVEEARRLAASTYAQNLFTAAVVLQHAGSSREAEEVFRRIAVPDSDLNGYMLWLLSRKQDALAEVTPEKISRGALTQLYYFPEFDSLRRDDRFIRLISGLGVMPAYERAQTERASWSNGPR